MIFDETFGKIFEETAQMVIMNNISSNIFQDIP
jgi:hypothetical protein